MTAALVGVLARSAAALLAGALVGCSNAGYYAQSVGGQLGILTKSRSVDAVLANPDTPDGVKSKLRAAKQIRAFASLHLGLPDNNSYKRYADVGRRFVVWNVFATPAYSLQPLEWCFPVAGCVAYRGYFDRDDAEVFAEGLRAEGHDVYVAGIRAYSTLGWFSDPLLNTLMNASEEQLAGFVFHELAHQVVYVKGDTTFNESFATAVEQAGVRRWLAQAERAGRLQGYLEQLERDARIVELLLETKQALGQVYASGHDRDWLQRRKQEAFAGLKSAYRRISAEWDGYGGYRGWFEQPLNNAHLASVGTYHELVPAFLALLERNGGDFASFYEEVRRIAALAPEPRREALPASP